MQSCVRRLRDHKAPYSKICIGTYILSMKNELYVYFVIFTFLLLEKLVQNYSIVRIFCKFVFNTLGNFLRRRRGKPESWLKARSPIYLDEPAVDVSVLQEEKLPVSDIWLYFFFSSFNLKVYILYLQ